MCLVGDGAAFEFTPLLNMLVMCGNILPTVMMILE